MVSPNHIASVLYWQILTSLEPPRASGASRRAPTALHFGKLSYHSDTWYTPIPSRTPSASARLRGFTTKCSFSLSRSLRPHQNCLSRTPVLDAGLDARRVHSIAGVLARTRQSRCRCAPSGGATCQGSARATTICSRVVTTGRGNLPMGVTRTEVRRFAAAAGLQLRLTVWVARSLAWNSQCYTPNPYAPGAEIAPWHLTCARRGECMTGHE